MPCRLPIGGWTSEAAKRGRGAVNEFRKVEKDRELECGVKWREGRRTGLSCVELRGRELKELRVWS